MPVSESTNVSMYISNPKISSNNIKNIKEVLEIVPFIEDKFLCVKPEGNFFRVVSYPTMLNYSQFFPGLYTSISDAKKAIEEVRLNPTHTWMQKLYEKQKKKDEIRELRRYNLTKRAKEDPEYYTRRNRKVTENRIKRLREQNGKSSETVHIIP